MELSERQSHIASILVDEAKSSSELANKLGVEQSTIRGHIDSLRDRGVEIEYDPKSNKFYVKNKKKVRRITTKATQTITREANEFATNQEATIIRRLDGKRALKADLTREPENQDVVVFLTDVHIGDVVEKTINGNTVEVFNSSIAVECIEHFTQEVINYIHQIVPEGKVDTVHLLWGGDIITNENIYDGQAWHVKEQLADQLSIAVDTLTQQAKTFAEEFDTLQVVAQPGNHGKTRASGVSKQANMDLLLYRWIQDRLIECGYENINFIESDAEWHINFDMRGGKMRGHLRHGHQSLKHVDSTGASSRDWRGWWAENRFDVAYRGHYHEYRREPIMNAYPVVEGPSMKPGSDFSSKIGQPDVSNYKKLGVVHGVSDKRPITWNKVIDDIDL
ncbi:MAG: winged helix-turn-helix domain-containing protein [Halopenitus sp.]